LGGHELISWSFQPLSHHLRHLLRHLPQLAPPQIVFVTEFAVNCCTVDHWVIRRGPLGGVEDQPPSTFFWALADATVDHFFWNHGAYLLVNEENQPLIMIMVGFGNLILSWKCLPSVPRAPRQERREK
jgi:hypothetical protein